MRNETLANAQHIRMDENDKVKAIMKHINAFIDEELKYAIIPDVVNIPSLPSVDDDIYSVGSQWNHVNFTPNSKRYMRLVRGNNHPSCSDLLAAINNIFYDSNIHLKVIQSLARDVAQLEHTDIIHPYVEFIPKNRRKYHYSCIVPICHNTQLIVENVLIDIPLGSMIMFRGDTSHAGAAFRRKNHRFFISIAHELFPVHKSVGLTVAETIN